VNWGTIYVYIEVWQQTSLYNYHILISCFKEAVEILGLFYDFFFLRIWWISFTRCLFCFGLFDGARVWTQGFALAKQAFYGLNQISSPFCSGYFGDGILQTICPGWPQTMILPISASQIARITDMSHRSPAKGKGSLIWNWTLGH
jgi:hypothetical protein